MFINDVHKKEEIKNIATQHLRNYGIKYRPKKSRPAPQVTRYGKKFFKVPLQTLETETVTLSNGQQLTIPKRIHEMCSYILSKVQTEGIFRKEGSKSRQNEIKLSLDRGCLLGNEHHVIDVAAVLKSFLRELPEPLIPQSYHEMFLRCSIGEKKLDAILLACLLLPSENLNVLSYLMQFFYEVASYSSCNKMSYINLSILVGPNIFPIDEKMVPKSSLMITKICDITKLLIENSRSIGVIPEYIIEQVGQLSEADNDKRRKNKRRSGSLTRMLNGLKKIVSSKTEEEPCPPRLAAPDLLSTPTIHNSMKKRKAENGLSLKKKKEVLSKLPDGSLLNTPFTPCRTPVSINPNGKKNDIIFDQDSGTENLKEKKMHWYMRSRSMKNLKDDESTASSNGNSRRNSFGPKSMLERRWSAVSSAANFRKKKRNSCVGSKTHVSVSDKNAKSKIEEPDYVRVPKVEYEEFKSRISEIERRISIELDTVQSRIDNNDNKANKKLDSNIQNVQIAYEKTLDQIGSLSPTTDQLARRLSRDLRIRRSSEQKIIRSPSARKIGTIRRRSTEREKKSARLVRNQSWHIGSAAVSNNTAPLLPRISMRKKKTQIEKENINLQNTSNLQRTSSYPKRSKKSTSLTRIQSSPHSFTMVTSMSDSGLSQPSTCHMSDNSADQWVSAEGYFGTIKTPQEVASSNARASVAKLRSQNAGMVRAKARLFDNLKDSDTSYSSIQSNGSANKSLNRSGRKNGSNKSSDSRISYRIKALRSEERKSKSLSPRRRLAMVSQKQKLQQIGRQYSRTTRGDTSAMETSQESLGLTTPRRDLQNTISPRKKTPQSHHVPYIKRPLIAKTPKRLCRTPGVDRKTPFKATPML